MGYLVKLLRAVTKATSRWTQNTQAAAKKGQGALRHSSMSKTYVSSLDGLIAEQFCYKLCLILSNVSVFCDAQLKEQVREKLVLFLTILQPSSLQVQEAQIDVLKTLVQEFIGRLAQNDGKQGMNCDPQTP